MDSVYQEYMMAASPLEACHALGCSFHGDHYFAE